MMLERFKKHDSKKHPIYVAEIDNSVIGFVYIDSYSPGRIALKQTAEISYFVDKNYRGKEVGKKLIEFMESQCNNLGITTLFTIIIEILRSFYFQRIRKEAWETNLYRLQRA
jgi:phosphinothricin acetyltransferase